MFKQRHPREFSAVLAIFVALLGLVSPRAVADPNPVFDAESMSFDVGPRPNDIAFIQPFQVRNVGSADLRITFEDVSCGCVSSSYGQMTIPPGESRTIEVGYDPALTGPREGFQSLTSSFTTNDSDSSKVSFTVHIHLIDEYSVTPTQIAFGVIEMNQVATKTVEVIIPSRELATSITGFHSSSVDLTVTESDRVDADTYTAYTYEVELDTSLLYGSLAETLTLETSSTQRPTFELPIGATLHTGVTVNPSRLILGRLKQGERRERKVVIKFPEPLAHLELHASATDPRVVPTLRRTGNDAEIAVVAIASKDTTPGAVLTNVEIRDADGNLLILIPVHMVIVSD